MQFKLDRKIGFDKEQVVLIQGAHTLDKEVQHFKTELLKLPEVKNVSISDFLPVAVTKRNGNSFWREGETKEESGVGAQSWTVDDDYLKIMAIRLAAGSNFSLSASSDSHPVLIHQHIAN